MGVVKIKRTTHSRKKCISWVERDDKEVESSTKQTEDRNWTDARDVHYLRSYEEAGTRIEFLRTAYEAAQDKA